MNFLYFLYSILFSLSIFYHSHTQIRMHAHTLCLPVDRKNCKICYAKSVCSLFVISVCLFVFLFPRRQPPPPSSNWSESENYFASSCRYRRQKTVFCGACIWSLSSWCQCSVSWSEFLSKDYFLPVKNLFIAFYIRFIYVSLDCLLSTLFRIISLEWICKSCIYFWLYNHIYEQICISVLLGVDDI